MIGIVDDGDEIGRAVVGEVAVADGQIWRRSAAVRGDRRQDAADGACGSFEGPAGAAIGCLQNVDIAGEYPCVTVVRQITQFGGKDAVGGDFHRLSVTFFLQHDVVGQDDSRRECRRLGPCIRLRSQFRRGLNADIEVWLSGIRLDLRGNRAYRVKDRPARVKQDQVASGFLPDRVVEIGATAG